MKKENETFMRDRAAYLAAKLIYFKVGAVAGDAGTARLGFPHLYDHASTIEDFDLALDPAIPVRSAAGAALKTVWLQRFDRRADPTDPRGNVKAAGSFSHRIKAYYLPFSQGAGHTMLLEQNADFFFTPTLNGCTFACGPGARPRVSHVNLQTPMGQIDQPAMNAMVTRLHEVGTQFVVRRADYKPPVIGATEDFQCMIVGIRGGAGWKFHAQRFRLDFTRPPYTYTINAIVALN
jgi:hypothetical protein